MLKPHLRAPDQPKQKIKICYEMAQDFAELYRDYAHKLKILEVAAGKKRRWGSLQGVASPATGRKVRKDSF